MKAAVTGASGGIGVVLCQRLVAAGYEVLGLDIAPGGGGVAEGVHLVDCDVADHRAVDAVANEAGTVDLLVNCAGIWRFAPLEEVTPEDFSRVIDVNLKGAFHCTRAFGLPMVDRRSGSIVNIVSIAAAHADPGVGSYSASKAGLLALTRQAAVEWGPYGVRVNAVGPGLVPTEGAGLYADETVRRQRTSLIPLRRLGQPFDIAETVAFLASEAASYVTGQVLYVDGGVSQTMMVQLSRPPTVAAPSSPSCSAADEGRA